MPTKKTNLDETKSTSSEQRIKPLTVLISISGRRLLQEGAGEAQGGVAADQVHLELRLGAHLGELLLLLLRLAFAEVVRVHRVVHVERYLDAAMGRVVLPPLSKGHHSL